MAKMKINKGNEPTSLAGKGKPTVYTAEQHKDMESKYGGDTRGMAAAMKTDIQGGNMPKRAPYGSETYKKESAPTSQQNMIRKSVENRAHNATVGPGSGAERLIEAERVKQPDALKKVTERSSSTQAAFKRKNEQEKKKGDDYTIVRRK
jgi:hypothetical protein